MLNEKLKICALPRSVISFKAMMALICTFKFYLGCCCFFVIATYFSSTIKKKKKTAIYLLNSFRDILNHTAHTTMSLNENAHYVTCLYGYFFVCLFV